MSLTRAMLKGMNLTEEQIQAIIDEHTNVTSALKNDIKKYQEQVDNFADVQKELDKLKSEKENLSGWEKKYNDEHKAFEDYKKDIVDKENAEKIKNAYKKLLTECNVGSKHIDSIIKVTDFSNMKFDKDGNLEGVEELKKTINDDWSGFISTSGVKGAKTEDPPGDDKGEGGKKLGRAAELAAKYHDNLYGKVKED